MNTKQKLALARILSSSLIFIRHRLGLPDCVAAKRQGKRWHLDLNQGIDLAIYAFGSFEPEVVSAYTKLIGPGAIVLDIGANIGAHTLPLAGVVGKDGHVFAFEPTDFAFEKLLRNIRANPDISSRVTGNQMMLVGQATPRPESIPSAWSLQTETSEAVHPIHGGTFNSLQGASVITLDAWAEQAAIQRIDLVKLDVDGFEVDVIEGGLGVLSRYRPTIIMEFAPYTFQDHGRSFDELLQLLIDLRYECKGFDGRSFPLDESLRKRIPRGGSINVILQPA